VRSKFVLKCEERLVCEVEIVSLVEGGLILIYIFHGGRDWREVRRLRREDFGDGQECIAFSPSSIPALNDAREQLSEEIC
jgi:hypothetical protein